MKNRYAFTMIELIFVIVVMGILSKYGVEFLAQAYHNFIFSKVNNELQSNAEMAVETIASRLQYRIKDSTIGRKSTNFNLFKPIQGIGDATYDVLEWVGIDEDAYRGVDNPRWSGIIDLKPSTSTMLISPETNTSAENTLIGTLSPKATTDINSSAIYFVGSNSNVNGYGWNGTTITEQNLTMHPIKTDANITHLIPRKGGTNNTNTFSGEDVYEYYQLAWTAYAIGFKPNTRTLMLWYDYQPWDGKKYTDGNSSIIMENVSSFKFKAVGSVMKIQVCVNSDLVKDENYSICKEKTVY